MPVAVYPLVGPPMSDTFWARCLTYSGRSGWRLGVGLPSFRNNPCNCEATVRKRVEVPWKKREISWVREIDIRTTMRHATSGPPLAYPCRYIPSRVLTATLPGTTSWVRSLWILRYVRPWATDSGPRPSQGLWPWCARCKNPQGVKFNWNKCWMGGIWRNSSLLPR
jgi:hypothetical protein